MADFPSGSKGWTLIEILITVAISSATVLLAAQLFQVAFGAYYGARDNLAIASARMIMQKSIAQNLSISDLRLYILNGSTVFSEAFSRAILPYPQSCADIHDANPICKQGTALIYGGIARDSKLKSLAYCWSIPGQQLVVDDKIGGLLANASNDRALLALLFPPVASVWSAETSIANIPRNALGRPNVPSSCYPFFERDNNGQYITSNRRLLNVQAVNFQGDLALIPFDVQTRMAKSFPMELRAGTVFSMGLSPSNKSTSEADFVLRECETSSRELISCRKTPIISLEGVQANRIELFFGSALGNEITVSRYQILAPGWSVWGSCLPPTCRGMNLLDSSNIPYLLPNESSRRLDPSAFSSIKQDILRRFDLILRDSQGKEYVINVPIQ